MGNANAGAADSASSATSSRSSVFDEAPPPPPLLSARRRSISTPNLPAGGERKRSGGFTGAAPLLCPDAMLPFAPPGALFAEPSSSPAAPPALAAAANSRTAPTHRWFRDASH